MHELKQANFRISTETANTFRTFCKENGMNQDQGFDHIMQVVEKEQSYSKFVKAILKIEKSY